MGELVLHFVIGFSNGLKKGGSMKKNVTFGIFIHFLCLSFLLSTSGFPNVAVEAKEVGLPIGEMVSRGEVKFEAKQKVWKNIESSHFPIFAKGKIQTLNGTGIITLANNCQVEVGPRSVLSIDQTEQLSLFQGKANFRIPPESEVVFKVGNLSVTRPRALQATRNPAMVFPKKNEETVGSISIHANGSVTVKSLKGSLSILDLDRTVLAGLSPKESITIPSITATGKSRTKVAQAGERKEQKRDKRKSDDSEWEYLGLSALEWIAFGYAALLGGGLYALWPDEDKDGELPLCR
jgi:hypothetical protein